jgi:hypothetical protein
MHVRTAETRAKAEHYLDVREPVSHKPLRKIEIRSSDFGLLLIGPGRGSFGPAIRELGMTMLYVVIACGLLSILYAI